MLDPSSFKCIIENDPLVSIDIFLIFKGKIFMGRRNNHLLKGEWFTPGGRIFKNEP
jgi:colanic acid biosynthesis protein WcaH